ncbi:MAG TPA: LysR family transcriptional regulator substrate-binding protein [Streptosporangiaceae bacterium]|nr:LysR family transcriptional regulator substrate-binding protein [Streptosporangiaceae bacterium]
MLSPATTTAAAAPTRSRFVEAVAADAEQAARGESVRVRVGVTQTAAAEIMPAALRAFRDDYPGVEVVLIADDPWVILTRRDSTIAARDSPGFEALDQQDVVAWSRRWRSQTELEDTWARRGIAPRIVYRTDDNLALQRLVAAGLGHACLGRAGASRAIDPSLTWLEPAEAPTGRTIALCYARHRPLTATARTLITAILAQAAY